MRYDYAHPRPDSSRIFVRRRYISSTLSPPSNHVYTLESVVTMFFSIWYKVAYKNSSSGWRFCHSYQLLIERRRIYLTRYREPEKKDANHYQRTSSAPVEDSREVDTSQFPLRRCIRSFYSLLFFAAACEFPIREA